VNDQRRSKRFEMQLPLILRSPATGSQAETCQTRNLSSGGVLFATHQAVSPGDLIEYDITLPANDASEETVTLHCRGRVLRSRPLEDPMETEVAATLERYEFVRPH
jgi:hypothetical protein